MAKNEAKIRFTAETGEFNDSIKKANNEMSKLRAELKLNETQMKSNGASVEALERQHGILENQLTASRSKVDALAAKVEVAGRIFGENSEEVSKLQRQLANAQTEEERLQQALTRCNSELREQAEAAARAESATGQLTDKINKQQSELKQLKNDYVEAVLKFGDTSDEAKDLAKQIDELSDELKDNQEAMAKAEDAADKLDNSYKDVGEAARNSSDGFTVMKGAVADLASEAIQFAIGKVTEFIGYLRELPEATRELRQDMATLETSFESAGFTTEVATNTWKELYTVFGEDDRAVEAANLISKMSDNQQDLNDWVTITKGVWGEYQDSLPVEALAESSNETAKTGKVTGNLADALNWSSEAAAMFSKYMSEDVVTAEDAFNEALAECTNEQERQALITDTLTALYGDSAAKYEEASGSQLAAKEATAENALAQAALADAIEPVTTAWDSMKAQLTTAIIPAVEKVSGVMLDALEWMKEHPVAVKAIAAAVGVLAVGITGLIIGITAWTVAQWALNSAILANPITWIIVGVIAALAAVAAIIVVVIEYWDEIKIAVQSCIESVSAAWKSFVSWLDTNVIQPVANFFSGLWEETTTGFSEAWEGVKSFFAAIPGWFDANVIKPVVSFFSGLWQGVKSAWDTVCNVVQVALMFVGELISAAFQIITIPFRFIWENCKETIVSAWEGIKTTVSNAISSVTEFITGFWNNIQESFWRVGGGLPGIVEVIFTSIKRIVINVSDAISNLLGVDLSSITLKTLAALNKIKNNIQGFLNNVKKVFTNGWNAIKDFTIKTWNDIKTKITAATNAIKKVVTKVWNEVKSVIQKASDSVKKTISTAWNAVKSTTTSAFNSVKSTASSAWNSVKSTVSSVVSGVKSTVSSAWNSLKSTTSSAFNSIKSTVSSVFNSIKNTASSVMNSVKSTVSSAVSKLKSAFNFSWSLPKIKLPHIKITGSFSLSPPSVPKFSISWYKDGGIMLKPTIFGINGNQLMAGGEAGPEAILPIDRLEGYVSNAVEKSMQAFDVRALAAAIEELADRPIELNINGRQFAMATASDGDSVNGLRSSFKSRGLIVD